MEKDEIKQGRPWGSEEREWSRTEENSGETCREALTVAPSQKMGWLIPQLLLLKPWSSEGSDSHATCRER